METLEFFRGQAHSLAPLVAFALLLGVVVCISRLSRWARAPAVIGLLPIISAICVSSFERTFYCLALWCNSFEYPSSVPESVFP